MARIAKKNMLNVVLVYSTKYLRNIWIGQSFTKRSEMRISNP